MKNLPKLSAALLALALPASALPAFPGAEGWGADTPAGRGPNPSAQPPKVYIVTTLASYGPGSLNEALRATGPRIIVFRVSGVIDLQPTGEMNEWYIAKEHSYVTIAGQTSPGGVTLVSGAPASSTIFSYKGDFHDAAFRFLRFRVTKLNEDALTFSGASNFVIDHCDFSGGRDETLDLSSNSRWTVQWCTVANSSEGQTYGFLIANYSHGHRYSIHHNLMANHVQRFPEMHWKDNPIIDNGLVDFRNNVDYNGRDYFFISSQFTTAPKSIFINFVGNTFKGGPDSPPNAESAEWFWSMVSLGEHLVGYEKDNVMINRSGVSDRNRVNARFANKRADPVEAPAVTTQSADDAYKLVLDKAGAWPRDPMNTRTINEVRTGTGQLRKDNDPKIASGPEAPADADKDGMADAWETLMGLDPASAADNVKDQDGDGYLNIEEYVNDIAFVRLGEPLLNPKGGSALAVFVTGINREAPIGGRMRVAAAGDRSSIGIRLPDGARAEGRFAISDMRGRVLADLPARAELEWRPRQGRIAPGTYHVSWIDGSRILVATRITIN